MGAEGGGPAAFGWLPRVCGPAAGRHRWGGSRADARLQPHKAGWVGSTASSSLGACPASRAPKSPLARQRSRDHCGPGARRGTTLRLHLAPKAKLKTRLNLDQNLVREPWRRAIARHNPHHASRIPERPVHHAHQAFRQARQAWLWTRPRPSTDRSATGRSSMITQTYATTLGFDATPSSDRAHPIGRYGRGRLVRELHLRCRSVRLLPRRGAVVRARSSVRPWAPSQGVLYQHIDGPRRRGCRAL